MRSRRVGHFRYGGGKAAARSARGKRGFLIRCLDGQLRFRVYLKVRGKRSFVDYDINAPDVEIRILEKYTTLYDSYARHVLDSSPEVLGITCPRHRQKQGFTGLVWKSSGDRHWLVTVPALDVMTQGKSKKDAYLMIKDAIEALVDKRNFKVTVHLGRGDHFIVTANEPNLLAALKMRRKKR